MSSLDLDSIVSYHFNELDFKHNSRGQNLSMLEPASENLACWLHYYTHTRLHVQTKKSPFSIFHRGHDGPFSVPCSVKGTLFYFPIMISDNNRSIHRRCYPRWRALGLRHAPDNSLSFDGFTQKFNVLHSLHFVLDLNVTASVTIQVINDLVTA